MSFSTGFIDVVGMGTADYTTVAMLRGEWLSVDGDTIALSTSRCPMLRIYGVAQSRAFRALWMAEECGVPYEHIPTHFQTDTKKPDYLRINPNGRVPTIDDDGVIVWESMAINLYLAKKYGKSLAPKDLLEDTMATQWSFWVMTEVEKPVLNALFARTGMMGVKKDEVEAKRLFGELKRPLDVLEAHLGSHGHLLGDRFTVADVNVASVLAWAQMGQFDLTGWPKVSGWLGRALARPAAVKALAM
jgi:glutathione S-transferase